MQNQWRVIDCTDLDGSISYERGRMRVVKNDTGECVDVPLAQIAVVLLGLHVRCSAAVLHEMARYGVSVMLCDWRGVPDAALHAWTDMPTTVTTRQLAQSNMSLPRKKSAWARIVQMKIRGQAACLDSSKLEGGGLLRGIAASVRSGDPSNCEVMLHVNIGGECFLKMRNSEGFRGRVMVGMRSWIMPIWCCEDSRLKR